MPPSSKGKRVRRKLPPARQLDSNGLLRVEVLAAVYGMETEQMAYKLREILLKLRKAAVDEGLGADDLVELFTTDERQVARSKKKAGHE